MGKVVGIDLGTTFSAIAHINDHGKPEVIPNAEGERITPSVILFDDDVTTVGQAALWNAIAHPEKIAQFVRLEMGKSKDEFSREFNGRKYSAEELSAIILKKLKQDAEAYLGTEITDAVITVPAYFKDVERQATRNAGEIAGLNVLKVLNEPAAVALAYGIDPHESDQTVFVFDLGGGTFDVTIMKVTESDLEVVAMNGDHSLGGKDWDERIITYVADFFEIEHGENPLDDLHTRQDLQLRAIDAKKFLFYRQEASIIVNYNGNVTRIDLTQEKFAELAADLLERCSTLCDVVLSEASMTWEDIDTVLLAGGSTRMPMIQDMLTQISGKKIDPPDINPDDAVALGAAIYATHWVRGNSQRDAFIAVADTLKSALGTLTEDQFIRLLQKAEQDYGLTQKEATQILYDLGLVVGEIVNYNDAVHYLIQLYDNFRRVEDQFTTICETFGTAETQNTDVNDPFESLDNWFKWYGNFKEQQQKKLMPSANNLLPILESLKELPHYQEDLLRFQNNLANLRYELEDILYRMNVIPYDEHPEKFDRRLHRAIDSRPTDNSELDLHVAEILKIGFYRSTEDKQGQVRKQMIRPEEVVIYRYQPPVDESK